MLYYILESMDATRPARFDGVSMRFCWDTRGGKHHYWVTSCDSKDELEKLHKKVGYGSFTARHEESMREELGKMGLQLRER